MKKLLVYLDEDTHEDLKGLAHRKKTTMAALVRHAVISTFEDDLDAIAGERALEELTRDTSSTISLDDYLRERGIELQGRDGKQGSPGPQRIAEGRRSYRVGESQ